MSFRLTDKKEIERLIKKGMLRGANKSTAKSYIASSSKKQNKRAAELNYSPLPPTLPVDILYNKLAARFGLWSQGGQLVRELTAPFTKRRFALDMALPAYKLGVEMDGWAFHGRFLNDFKRDREKQLLFARFGWILIRVSNDQIRNNLDNVITSIEECVSYRPAMIAQIKKNGFGCHQCITNPVMAITSHSKPVTSSKC